MNDLGTDWVYEQMILHFPERAHMFRKKSEFGAVIFQPDVLVYNTFKNAALVIETDDPRSYDPMEDAKRMVGVALEMGKRPIMRKHVFWIHIGDPEQFELVVKVTKAFFDRKFPSGEIALTAEYIGHESKKTRHVRDLLAKAEIPATAQIHIETMMSTIPHCVTHGAGTHVGKGRCRTCNKRNFMCRDHKKHRYTCSTCKKSGLCAGTYHGPWFPAPKTDMENLLCDACFETMRYGDPKPIDTVVAKFLSHHFKKLEKYATKTYHIEDCNQIVDWYVDIPGKPIVILEIDDLAAPALARDEARRMLIACECLDREVIWIRFNPFFEEKTEYECLRGLKEMLEDKFKSPKDDENQFSFLFYPPYRQREIESWLIYYTQNEEELLDPLPEEKPDADEHTKKVYIFATAPKFKVPPIKRFV